MASLSIGIEAFRGRMAVWLAASMALHLAALAVFELTNRAHSRRSEPLIIPVELSFAAPTPRTAPASQAKPLPNTPPSQATRPLSPALKTKPNAKPAPGGALGALWSNVCTNLRAGERKQLNMPDCNPTQRVLSKAATAAVHNEQRAALDAQALREGWEAPTRAKVIADPAIGRGAFLPSARVLGVPRPVPLIRMAMDRKGAKLSGLGLLGVITPAQVQVTPLTRLADDYRYRAAKDRAAGAGR